jgi:hypothetical protein
MIGYLELIHLFLTSLLLNGSERKRGDSLKQPSLQH